VNWVSALQSGAAIKHSEMLAIQCVAHAVDSRTSFVRFDSLVRLPAVFPLADFFHQLLVSSWTFGFAFRRARFGPFPRSLRSFTPPLLIESCVLLAAPYCLGLHRLCDCRVGGGAPKRWPPSAAQTARTVFPYAAFTKTGHYEMREKELTLPSSQAHTHRTAWP